MNQEDQLADYIQKARANGMADIQISNSLLASGWDAATVNRLIGNLPAGQKYSVYPQGVSKPAVANKGKRTKRLVGAVLGFVIIASLLVIAWLFLLKPVSHEDIFRAMLRNSISKESNSLVYKLADGDSDEVNFSAMVDYSDTSRVSLQGSGTMKSEAIGADVQFEAIADGEYVYLKFSKYNLANTAALSDDAIGKWIRFDTKVDSISRSYLVTLGIADSVEAIASVRGEIPDGNFSSEEQSKLLELMAIDETYKILESSDAPQAGDDIVEYKVSIDQTKVRELDKLVAEAAGVDYSSTPSDYLEVEGRDYLFYINKSTEQLHEVTARAENDKTLSVAYSDYDQSFDIDIPDLYMNAEEFSAQVDQEILGRAISGINPD